MSCYIGTCYLETEEHNYLCSQPNSFLFFASEGFINSLFFRPRQNSTAKKPIKRGLKRQVNTLILVPKFILRCLLVISFLLPILNGPYENLLQHISAQADQGDATNSSPAPEDIEANDSFSAIGEIASLVITVPESDFNITDAFKVILTGKWNLSVRNGTVTNFNVAFAATPMDGRGPHIHQITDFNPYDNEQPIVLQQESVMMNGTADIRINGIIAWERADISISISEGNTFYIDPDDEDTEDHFGNQQVYGIVTRLIS